MRDIKFRVWDEESNGWLNTGDTDFFIGINNFGVVVNDRDNMNNLSLMDFAVIQQFTGLQDKNGKEIYEGDIIRFDYSCGDFAFSDMSDEEREAELNIQGTYIGKVVPKMLEPSNLEIVVGDRYLFFPLFYASGSEIIGNIFETPELLEKNA